MKTLFSVFLLLLSPLVMAQAPPATVSKTLTNGATSLTVNFALHPIRSVNYNVQVQDATGAFTPYTADVPRTYIGTVTGRPGAIAAGYQKANGTFLSYISFEDGTTWSSSGTAASAGGSTSWTPNVYPTTGVGAGGAGSAVKAAELGIDASYREWQAVGSNLVSAIDMIEFCTMKANIVYLRDAAILHRLGRIVIRTDAAKCPYQALPSSTTTEWSVLLNTMKDQWNNVLPPVLGASAHDVASLVRPGVGGGLASVGVIGTASRYSITGASSGDFLSAWRHELGHNWSSSHFEGGGKPEGGTIMSDNNLARFSSSELAKIINHRNAKSGVLDNLGAYTFPLPPRVFGDRVTMSGNSISTTIDVLVNDSDSNGEALTLPSFDGASTKRSLVVRLPGTGPSGRDQLIYYAPPNYTSGFDYFNYRIQDAAGYQGIGKVYVNPVKLQPLPPLWTSSDIGGTGAAGDAGTKGGTYVIYGSGADIWGAADEFRFVRQTANGDCDLRARVTGQANTNGYAKAGVMLRNDTAADAAHASIFVTPSNGFSFQYRSATAGATTNVNGPALNAGINNWVRLTRVGSLITSYTSADGIAWTQVGTATIPMAATIQAGLAVTSHVDASLGGAAFDRVSLRHAEPFATLLSDTFESGTAANDAADPTDATWFSGSTLSVAADTTLGTGQALNADGGTYNSIDTTFAGRALTQTGDVLKLSFDFRYTQAPGNLAAGFRFGLFNNSGDGFMVHHGTGGNGSWSLVEDGGADGSFGFGSVTTLANSTKASLNDLTKHSASLLLRKTDTGISVTATVDGVTLSGTDTSPSAIAFDYLLLSNGNMTADFRVDNVRIESFHVAPAMFTADPFSKTPAAIGLAYSGSLTANVTIPHPGHVYTKTGGPAWLTVAADGTLFGIPAAGDAGSNSFNVHVTSEDSQFDDAVMTIPVAYPVTVAASDATASEDDLSTGTFTLTRTGPTTSPLTVNFTVGGTALSGGDYTAIGTSAVIPAGQASVPVVITPLDDSLLEPSETVVLTLSSSASYAFSVSASATVTLADDESLFVRMNDGFDSVTATAGNDGDDPFDSAWTGSTLSVATDATFATGKALNVDPTGTFGGAKGSFTARSLPANGDSITLSFDFRYTAAPTNVSAGLRFGLYNSTGAGFCIHHGTGGNGGIGINECPDGTFGSGTLTGISSGSKASINDQLKHVIVLKLRKTAAGMVVTSTVDGVTHTGTDATPVITTFDTVFISNGNQNVDFRLDNVRVEYSPNLAPDFTTDPLVKSAVIDLPVIGSLAADAIDPNPGDTFTFAKTAGPGWLSIAANSALTGTPTAAQAGANQFTVRLTDNFGVFSDATLIVNVGHPVTVTANHPLARELEELPGSFLITRGGPLTSSLTVPYTFSGTATPGEDYTATASAVIPAGQNSVEVPLVPLDDDAFEDDETVILTLSPDASYAVVAPANTTVTISDDETSVDQIDDTFDVGAVPTAGDDADDSDDVAWTPGAGTVSVGDDATFGTGNALLFDATGTFSLARANFAAIELLQPGDTLHLSFDFRFTAAPPNVGSGLRFGLYNNAGDGFLVQQGVGGATGWALAEDTAADNGFGSGGTVSGLASAGRASINDQLPHSFALTLVKTATGIVITGGADGSILTFTDTTPVATAFSALGIRFGNFTTDFAVDNVHFEVVRNRAPFFIANPLEKPVASAGINYLETLGSDALDPNADDALTFTKLTGPAWLTIAADGTVDGTPELANAGLNTFTVRVTDDSGLSGETTVSINVLNSPIETWRQQQFGADAADPDMAGNDADIDGDGLINLIEYALGTDPNASSPLPAAVIEGGLLTLTYTKNLLATDVTLIPEWSEDLMSWEAAGVTLDAVGEAGSIQTLKASVPATGPARFLHLKVTAP